MVGAGVEGGEKGEVDAGGESGWVHDFCNHDNQYLIQSQNLNLGH